MHNRYLILNNWY